MMDTRNQEERAAHSTLFHEEQLPLFDAFATNELDEDERAQVEQNLRQCLECRHLFAEVTRVRQSLGALAETEHSADLAHIQLHAPSLSQAVFERLEQEEKWYPPTEGARMKGPVVSSHLRWTNSTALLAQKRAKRTYLTFGIAVCLVILLAGLIVTLRDVSLSSNRGSQSVPSPTVWTVQQPMIAQNSTGVFALKEIEITTAKEFRFYYALQSSSPRTIHVTAISSLNGDQQSVALHATVWALGTIDGISVGVIRVQYSNRVGQTIKLTITSQGTKNMSWQFTPLKQVLAEPHPEGGGYYGFPIDQHLFPEIVWSGPGSGLGGPMVSFFKDAANAHYIFLEVDYSGKVIIITREQCVQFTSEQACQ